MIYFISYFIKIPSQKFDWLIKKQKICQLNLQNYYSYFSSKHKKIFFFSSKFYLNFSFMFWIRNIFCLHLVLRCRRFLRISIWLTYSPWRCLRHIVSCSMRGKSWLQNFIDFIFSWWVIYIFLPGILTR